MEVGWDLVSTGVWIWEFPSLGSAGWGGALVTDALHDRPDFDLDRLKVI